MGWPGHTKTLYDASSEWDCFGSISLIETLLVLSMLVDRHMYITWHPRIKMGACRVCMGYQVRHMVEWFGVCKCCRNKSMKLPILWKEQKYNILFMDFTISQLEVLLESHGCPVWSMISTIEDPLSPIGVVIAPLSIWFIPPPFHHGNPTAFQTRTGPWGAACWSMPARQWDWCGLWSSPVLQLGHGSPGCESSLGTWKRFGCANKCCDKLLM